MTTRYQDEPAYFYKVILKMRYILQRLRSNRAVIKTDPNLSMKKNCGMVRICV